MKLDSRFLELKTDVCKLSDKILLEQAEYIAEHERGVTILALRHLREIEIRRLFADLGYSSMYLYCTKHLKYSENKTQTRLSSARLMTELPEIEKQIESGSLNITNLSKVQSFVRAEKQVQHVLTKEEKLSILEKCENRTTREVAKELIQKSHQPEVLAEKFHITTVVMNDSLNLDFSKFEALMNSDDKLLLEEFINFYAHELNDLSNITVLRLLLTKAMQTKKKQLGLETKASEKKPKTLNAPPPMSPEVTKATHQRTALPATTKRLVWQKAQASCEHIDHKTGKKCSSKFALQPDHIVAVALGGTNEHENLRLLCRVHNSRRAIQTFGARRF